MIASRSGPAFWHFINRDPTEQYVAVFLLVEAPRVGPPDRTRARRRVPQRRVLHRYGKPRPDLKAITVADFTFVVNTGVAVSST